MTTTFIVSESKVKQYTPLNNNVDNELVTNCIREAQDIHLQTVIGTKLYRKILSEIKNDTLSGIYKTIVDEYIENFLIYAVYYESLDEINTRPRNNGLLKPSGGENSQSISTSDYQLKRQGVKNKMEFYAQRLAEYLCENSNSIPELNSVQFLYEMYPNLSNQYKSPFVFGKNKNVVLMKKMGIPIIDSTKTPL